MIPAGIERDPKSLANTKIPTDLSPQIFRLSDLATPIYTADGLGFLPPFLSTEFTVRRSAAKEILTEILVTELGDATTKSPYLIVSQKSNC